MLYMKSGILQYDDMQVHHTFVAIKPGETCFETCHMQGCDCQVNFRWHEVSPCKPCSLRLDVHSTFVITPATFSHLGATACMWQVVPDLPLLATTKAAWA